MLPTSMCEADQGQEGHVVAAGEPDGARGTFGAFGAEVLPDQSGGSGADSPGRQEGEHDDAQGDGVAGDCFAAEQGIDTGEAHPACGGDEVLDHGGAAHAQQKSASGTRPRR